MKGIVMRVLQENANRAQRKKMIQSEIGRLQIQSDALLQQVNYLTQPVVKLSSSERRLFKKPVFDVQDPNTLVAIKNDAPIGAEPAAHPAETAPAISNTGEPAVTPAPSAEPANSSPSSEGAAPAPDAGKPKTDTKPIETTKLEN